MKRRDLIEQVEAAGAQLIRHGRQARQLPQLKKRSDKADSQAQVNQRTSCSKDFARPHKGDGTQALCRNSQMGFLEISCFSVRLTKQKDFGEMGSSGFNNSSWVATLRGTGCVGDDTAAR
jgi:hypothetical protein